jgi:hypothetical protein
VRCCRGVSGLVIFDLAAGCSTDYRDDVGRSLGAELARDRGRSRLVEERRDHRVDDQVHSIDASDGSVNQLQGADQGIFRQ